MKKNTKILVIVLAVLVILAVLVSRERQVIRDVPHKRMNPLRSSLTISPLVCLTPLHLWQSLP